MMFIFEAILQKTMQAYILLRRKFAKELLNLSVVRIREN